MFPYRIILVLLSLSCFRVILVLLSLAITVMYYVSLQDDSGSSFTIATMSPYNRMILVPESQIPLGGRIHVGNPGCIRGVCKILRNANRDDVMNYFLAHVAYSFYHR